MVEMLSDNVAIILGIAALLLALTTPFFSPLFRWKRKEEEAHDVDSQPVSIRPVHTSADGDSIYAVSLGKLAADQDVVGALGARVMSEAILRAVQSADAAYGLPCAKDFQ